MRNAKEPIIFNAGWKVIDGTGERSESVFTKKLLLEEASPKLRLIFEQKKN